jgi:hypothetical protein
MGTSSTLDDRLRHLIDALFDHGWQPADVAHLAKRHSTQRGTRLVLGYIAQHTRRTDAPTRAPHEWLGQLRDLGLFDPATGAVIGGHGEVLQRWSRAEKLDPDEVRDTAVDLVVALSKAPRLGMLLPPPSAWGASNRGVAPGPVDAGEVDAKALKTIRALLAKAEATTFEAEADAFTSKAQELMTRHSIDAAVLAAHAAGAGSHAGIRSRRVHIDHPYADEKSGFLAVIAEVNGAKCVWSPSAGFSTLMGFPVDLQLTDVLFTSLLVQATHASTLATAHDRRLRTPSFRRAFLVSFADRIAERLEAARAQVTHDAEVEYGSSLVPVLAERDAAVEAAYAQAFPNVTLMPARRYNAYGWHAGREAADRADIGAGAAIDAG